MKRLAKLAPVMLFALCFAATSWAGGANCSPDGAKKASVKATLTGAGAHCEGKDANTNAMAARECGVKANQAIYSFAVPSVECDRCTENIQKAAMAMDGVACAHVDISSHTAYIIADQKVGRSEISKVIEKAGYKNKFSSKGKKAQVAFAKAMASGEKSVACCSKSKDRV